MRARTAVTPSPCCAASSASMLRQQVRIEPQDLGSVRFSWKVPD